MVSSHPTRIAGFLVFLLVSAPVFSASPQLEEAVSLLHRIHLDQCQRHQLRGQVMVAHREHDKKRLNALFPELDAITRKLKADESHLSALRDQLSGNASDQNAFESVMLELGQCD